MEGPHGALITLPPRHVGLREGGGDWETGGIGDGENRRGPDWVQGEIERVQWESGSGAAGLGLADTHLAAARATHRVLASTCVTFDELLACGERRVRAGRTSGDGRDVRDTHRCGCTCRQAGWGFPHSPGHTCGEHGLVGGSRGGDTRSQMALCPHPAHPPLTAATSIARGTGVTGGLAICVQEARFREPTVRGR